MQTDSMKVWDPEIEYGQSERNKLLRINVSLFIYSFLATIMAVNVDDVADTGMKE